MKEEDSQKSEPHPRKFKKPHFKINANASIDQECIEEYKQYLWLSELLKDIKFDFKSKQQLT